MFLIAKIVPNGSEYGKFLIYRRLWPMAKAERVRKCIENGQTERICYTDRQDRVPIE